MLIFTIENRHISISIEAVLTNVSIEVFVKSSGTLYSRDFFPISWLINLLKLRAEKVEGDNN